jgi:hypothetical protein
MTPTPHLTISEEAREAGKQLTNYSPELYSTISKYRPLAEEIVQLAINQATAKLEEELADKATEAQNFQTEWEVSKREVTTLEERVRELEKENVRLKRAFQDEYQKDP